MLMVEIGEKKYHEECWEGEGGDYFSWREGVVPDRCAGCGELIFLPPPVGEIRKMFPGLSVSEMRRTLLQLAAELGEEDA